MVGNGKARSFTRSPPWRWAIVSMSQLATLLTRAQFVDRGRREGGVEQLSDVLVSGAILENEQAAQPVAEGFELDALVWGKSVDETVGASGTGLDAAEQIDAFLIVAA